MRFDGCKMISLGIELNSLTSIRAEPESILLLGVDRFINHLMEAIDLLPMLFYFYFTESFRSFKNY